eukprot:2721307-Pyramimonas_sp.AAC.1
MADGGSQNPRPPAPSEVLQSIAARVLMKISYGARIARNDLLRATCTVASCVAKWTDGRALLASGAG